jgi:hypothetical protein
MLPHRPYKNITKEDLQITKIDLEESLPSNDFTAPRATKSFLVKSTQNLLEKTFLQLLIFSRLRKLEFLVPSRYLSTPILQTIYLEIKHCKSTEIADLMKLFENNSEQKILFEEIIFRSTEIEENIEEQLQKIVKRLKKEYLTRQQKALSVKIAIAEESNNSEETDRLLTRCKS